MCELGLTENSIVIELDHRKVMARLKRVRAEAGANDQFSNLSGKRVRYGWRFVRQESLFYGCPYLISVTDERLVSSQRKLSCSDLH